MWKLSTFNVLQAHFKSIMTYIQTNIKYFFCIIFVFCSLKKSLGKKMTIIRYEYIRYELGMF